MNWITGVHSSHAASLYDPAHHVFGKKTAIAMHLSPQHTVSVLVYIGGHGGMNESGLCVLCEPRPVSTPVAGECPPVPLQSCYMSTVVMMGRWPDYSACRVVHNAPSHSVSDTAVAYGEDARRSQCARVQGHVVRVADDICYQPSPWPPVHECHKVECAPTSPVVVVVVCHDQVRLQVSQGFRCRDS